MGGKARTGSMPTRAGARPREAQVGVSGSIPPHALTRPLQGLLAQSRWCETNEATDIRSSSSFVCPLSFIC